MSKTIATELENNKENDFLNSLKANEPLKKVLFKAKNVSKTLMSHIVPQMAKAVNSLMVEINSGKKTSLKDWNTIKFFNPRYSWYGCLVWLSTFGKIIPIGLFVIFPTSSWFTKFASLPKASASVAGITNKSIHHSNNHTNSQASNYAHSMKASSPAIKLPFVFTLLLSEGRTVARSPNGLYCATESITRSSRQYTKSK